MLQTLTGSSGKVRRIQVLRIRMDHYLHFRRKYKLLTSDAKTSFSSVSCFCQAVYLISGAKYRNSFLIEASNAAINYGAVLQTQLRRSAASQKKVLKSQQPAHNAVALNAGMVEDVNARDTELVNPPVANIDQASLRTQDLFFLIQLLPWQRKFSGQRSKHCKRAKCLREDSVCILKYLHIPSAEHLLMGQVT